MYDSAENSSLLINTSKYFIFVYNYKTNIRINLISIIKKFFKIAKAVISKELETILLERLANSFSASVELILKSNGKVIIVGVGKS